MRTGIKNRFKIGMWLIIAIAMVGVLSFGFHLPDYCKGGYRVAWKSKVTGYEGHGEWFDDHSLVAYAVQEGNKDGDIEHWIEEENSSAHKPLIKNLDNFIDFL